MYKQLLTSPGGAYFRSHVVQELLHLVEALVVYGDVDSSHSCTQDNGVGRYQQGHGYIRGM